LEGLIPSASHNKGVRLKSRICGRGQRMARSCEKAVRRKIFEQSLRVGKAKARDSDFEMIAKSC